MLKGIQRAFEKLYVMISTPLFSSDEPIAYIP